LRSGEKGGMFFGRRCGGDGGNGTSCEQQIPFGFAQGRLSCLAALARRNDKDCSDGYFCEGCLRELSSLGYWLTSIEAGEII
jgi:hypothetical protein